MAHEIEDIMAPKVRPPVQPITQTTQRRMALEMLYKQEVLNALVRQFRNSPQWQNLTDEEQSLMAESLWGKYKMFMMQGTPNFSAGEMPESMREGATEEMPNIESPGTEDEIPVIDDKARNLFRWYVSKYGLEIGI